MEKKRGEGKEKGEGERKTTTERQGVVFAIKQTRKTATMKPEITEIPDAVMQAHVNQVDPQGFQRTFELRGLCAR